MAETQHFRVIIAGGGIAGLTLANALEKANVDYLLLEARDTIAPQVGASIGVFANGLRIFDQIGCFENIASEIVPLKATYHRKKNGDLVYIGSGIPLTHKRFNYHAAFLERQYVLRILYDNLVDKSKIKLTKRISQVDHNEEEVIVLCEDGTAISADVLVGCDGVNSKVREELWRVAQSQESSAVHSEDKERLIAEYKCLYGISTATHGLEEGDVHINYSEGSSLLTIVSKGRVFWFVMQILDQVYKVPNIPRYTKHDADEFAATIQDNHITPTLTFGGVWNNRTSYTLVALEEAQMKHWTWGRIACVGDCIHKMTPNMGAGGNTAIESAAALANEIKAITDTSEKGKPSFDDIKTALGKYQQTRESRVTEILKAANALTRIQALKTWKDRLLAFWIIPIAIDLLNDISCDMIMGAVKLDYLPIPDQSLRGTMPFNPSQGLGKKESKLRRALKAIPFLGITAVAMYFMWGITLPNMIPRIMEIWDKGIDNNIGTPGHVFMYNSFYGIEFIDSRIRGLATCFASFQFADVVGSWQAFSFLTDTGIVYAILLIEGARKANIMTFAYVPLLLGYNMQFFGIGVVMALYCFMHYVQSPVENFRARDMRLTDMSCTASVLPVLVLAHYIPNFGSFTSFVDPQTRHMWNWIWQPFPVYVSMLQFVLRKTVIPHTMREDSVKNPDRDLPTIRFTIGSLCVLSAATWWYTLYAAPISWTEMFIPNIAAGQTGDEYIRMFLQFDEIFCMGACFLWLLYLYGDMKRAGMLDDSWISITLKGVVSLATFGPGVTVGLGWLHRETILATKWHKDALVPQ